jgi:hypothetical protein
LKKNGKMADCKRYYECVAVITNARDVMAIILYLSCEGIECCANTRLKAKELMQIILSNISLIIITQIKLYFNLVGL